MQQPTCALILALVLALAAAPAARAADAKHGSVVFATNCDSCHSVQPGRNKMGPSLFGVVGRKAGAAPGYSYSKAMAGAGMTWGPDKLDAYLSGPQKLLPGVRMTFPGLNKASDRADIIAYLSTLK